MVDNCITWIIDNNVPPFSLCTNKSIFKLDVLSYGKLPLHFQNASYALVVSLLLNSHTSLYIKTHMVYDYNNI